MAKEQKKQTTKEPKKKPETTNEPKKKKPKVVDTKKEASKVKQAATTVDAKSEPKHKKKTTTKATTSQKPKPKSSPSQKSSKESASQAKPDSTNEILETFDFSNEMVDVHVSTKKNCKVEFRATPKEPVHEQAEKKALKSIKKEISIPGFRKGKAPENLIRKQYAAALKERSEKELVDVAFFESIKLSRYTPFDPKKSKFNGYTDDKKTLKFEIECYPKLPELDFSDWSLPNIKKSEMTQAHYDEAMDKLLNMYSEQKDVTDRGVKESDFILVDVEDLDSEKAEKVFSNTRFEVASGKISDWMKEAVIGKKTAESIETISKPDHDASEDEKKEFKEKKVKITINQIQEVSLPELNDEFAKKYQLNTVKELEQAIKDALDSKFEKEWTKEMRDEVGKKLKALDFEIPGSILEQESNHRMTQKFQDPKFKTEWAKLDDDAKDAKKDEVVQESKESLVLMFVTQKIIAENKLKIQEPKENATPKPLQMAIDFDPMMFFNPSTQEQKNIDYSMRTIHTAEDFIIQTLQKKG